MWRRWKLGSCDARSLVGNTFCSLCLGTWVTRYYDRGISSIRLVDFDYVTLSSLNRHATATLADVGTPKVKCVEKALQSFSKWIKVESCIELWRAEDGAWLLDDVDWVVGTYLHLSCGKHPQFSTPGLRSDAIDNIGTKVDLLKYCHQKGIKVFASMGAGAKCDPTRIQIRSVSCSLSQLDLDLESDAFRNPVTYPTLSMIPSHAPSVAVSAQKASHPAFP